METPINPYPPLLSLAVHELRTPASVVGGYLRMLQRDQDPPMSERQLHMIDEAEKSCARFVAIVAELSEIGKLDSGAVKFAQRRFDMFSLIGEVAELVHEGSDRDVHFKLLGPRDGAPMHGDPTRLHTAFQAIFFFFFREHAGPATVVAERRRETVDGEPSAVVVVASEESTQEAYDRASEPFDDRRGGLGLALPLARRVIEGHRGRMRSPAPASSTSANANSFARSSVVISFPLGS